MIICISCDATRFCIFRLAAVQVEWDWENPVPRLALVPTKWLRARCCRQQHAPDLPEPDVLNSFAYSTSNGLYYFEDVSQATPNARSIILCRQLSLMYHIRIKRCYTPRSLGLWHA